MSIAHVAATGNVLRELARDLQGSRVSQSPLSPGITLESLTAGTTQCVVIKTNQRRSVFMLYTPRGQYFLKLSKLIRSKDRIRHFFLPARRDAEWRNLHRLRSKAIAAAVPALKGHKKGRFFFLLTERVAGTAPALQSSVEAEALGRYIRYLHDKGIYHADLHPGNIILQQDGHPCLIDAQEVYFLPFMPRPIRVHNLGKWFHHVTTLGVTDQWTEAFFKTYNEGGRPFIARGDIIESRECHRQRRYRSRAKRCAKDSSEFAIVQGEGIWGYRRREFHWGLPELRNALHEGQPIKREHVFRYGGVCIKKYRRRFLHKDRCLRAWKMSRALEVREIPVAKALAYFRTGRNSYFLSEFLVDGIRLNDYLSSIVEELQKRKAIKAFAQWVRHVHDLGIWQRDFKSTNVLWQDGRFHMLDLESIAIPRRLPTGRKVYNLAQLNASISNAVTLRNRLCFFHHYSRGLCLSRKTRRRTYRQIWAITRTKETSFFGLDTDSLTL
jgi:tRNA A-37 threonylcarbamoyl transferase component Bud32